MEKFRSRTRPTLLSVSPVFIIAGSAIPSLNLILAWLPLQNGMLLERRIRQSVTRFRLRKGRVMRFDEYASRTHNGPLTPRAGSSTLQWMAKLGQYPDGSFVIHDELDLRGNDLLRVWLVRGLR